MTGIAPDKRHEGDIIMEKIANTLTGTTAALAALILSLGTISATVSPTAFTAAPAFAQEIAA